MSIVRVGLGEERSFASGYEAIFGKGTKKAAAPAPKAKKAPAKPAAKPAAKAKKPVAKAKKK